ncbi:MAG: FKBP-type peptidyl-prolyl cis-trans isomerase [Betaproteobacteria bacterium]
MRTPRAITLLTTIALLTAAGVASAAETVKTDTKKTPAASAANEIKVVKLTAKQRLPKTVKQVTIIDREPGDSSSETAVHDNAVLVHYTGWLYDPKKPDGKGEQFDTSRERYTPFGFFIGAGKVIKGWDLGISGMKIKGKRTLIIPPALAYGDKERPKIPANSTLIFDVELVDILGKRDQKPNSTTTAAPTTPPPAPLPANVTRLAPQDALPAAPSTITAIDQAAGDGPAAETGNDVLVHYTGWLYDASLPGGKGKQFDSSRDRNQLFRFKLGAGRVIRGWDVGVVGMKVKGKRTLIIPADFGYGVRGAGGVIPPNATLIFDVELVELPPA